MRYLIPTVLLGLATTANAQEIKGDIIELSVTDTISRVVKTITYDFNPSDTDELYNDASLNWEEAHERAMEKAKKRLAQLKKEASKQGFSVVPQTTLGDPWTIEPSRHSDPNMIRFELKSKAELERLAGWLRTLGYGSGYVLNWEFEAQPGTEDALLERLLTKAARQAGRMAELSGRKLGELVSISDPEAREATLKDLMRISLRDRNAHNDDQNWERTLVFRFRLVSK